MGTPRLAIFAVLSSRMQILLPVPTPLPHGVCRRSRTPDPDPPVSDQPRLRAGATPGGATPTPRSQRSQPSDPLPRRQASTMHITAPRSQPGGCMQRARPAGEPPRWGQSQAWPMAGRPPARWPTPRGPAAPPSRATLPPQRQHPRTAQLQAPVPTQRQHTNSARRPPPPLAPTPTFTTHRENRKSILDSDRHKVLQNNVANRGTDKTE